MTRHSLFRLYLLRPPTALGCICYGQIGHFCTTTLLRRSWLFGPIYLPQTPIRSAGSPPRTLDDLSRLDMFAPGSLASNGRDRHSRFMDLDDQLRRYFGSADLSALPDTALEAGLERARVEFGLEKDRSRRFAMWAFMYTFNAAPDLDIAFKNEDDREAARDFMDMVDKASEH